VRAELLIIDGSLLTWRHALTREAIWAGLLLLERSMLSRRAARVLLERGGPDQELLAAELLVEAGTSTMAPLCCYELPSESWPRGRCTAPNRFSIR
jgi:hypothetical protein